MSVGRRVLIVSFFYPPNPAVGGLRVSKFAEYLPEFGWEPTVLTARSTPGGPPQDGHVIATSYFAPLMKAKARHASPRSGEGVGPAESAPGLQERLEAAGPLGRRTYNALRHFAPLSSVRMPDSTMGWIPYAVAEGRRLIRSEQFDAIFSSAGPPSSHIVAARIQRRAGIPWTADFRDLWANNHWDSRVRPFRWLEERLERLVLKPARALTTVSPAWAERLEKLHGTPAEVIYNGFDPKDYTAEPAPAGTGAEAFILTYVGSLYWPHQNPEPLFVALADLEKRSKTALDRVRFQLRFIGTAPRVIESLARRYAVESRVVILPRVPHPKSLAYQKSSAALLYFGWHKATEGFIGAKLFEYLGAGRPLLAIGPSGGADSKVLSDCGRQQLTEDSGEIIAQLKLWLDEFMRTGRLAERVDASAALPFTRKAQTEKLAALLDEGASHLARTRKSR